MQRRSLISVRRQPLIALTLVGYLALLIRLRRDGRSWPALRTFSALAAAALLVLVVNGALAVYGHHCSGCT
jgi:putative membrane protein